MSTSLIDTSAPSLNHRNYGIDLLRMLSMYMVCMLHTLGRGGIITSTSSDPVKNHIAWLFEIAAYCSINCFAMISGYVGVKSRFKYRNILRLWLQALFYTVSITLIFLVIRPSSVSKKDIILAFFPISSKTYWYLSAYTLMFFLIPQMNFILENQGKNIIKTFIWTFFILFSLCSLPILIRGIASPVQSGYSAIWLAYLYIIGGFIRIYGITELFIFSPINHKNKTLSHYINTLFGSQLGRFSVYMVCTLFTYFIYTCGPHITKVILGRKISFFSFVDYTSPTTLMAAIALLELFSHLSLDSCSTIIRLASPLAFSVYLIHCQRLFYRLVFEGAFVKVAEFPTFVLPFAIIIIPLIIYISCSLIDFVRLKLFKLLRIA